MEKFFDGYLLKFTQRRPEVTYKISFDQKGVLVENSELKPCSSSKQTFKYSIISTYKSKRFGGDS